MKLRCLLLEMIRCFACFDFSIGQIRGPSLLPRSLLSYDLSVLVSVLYIPLLIGPSYVATSDDLDWRASVRRHV